MARAPLTPEEFQAAMAKAGPQVMASMRDSLLRYARDFALGVVPRLVVANLHNRRGGAGLAGSFHADPTGGDDDPGVVVYTHSPYARLQERGGTVTAKGRYLTIPVGPAKTAAGVTRGSARAWPASETFVGRTPGGHLAVMLRDKTGTGATPIFLLRRQVTIPPRLGLLAAWDKEDGIRRELLGRAIERGLAGVA